MFIYKIKHLKAGIQSPAVFLRRIGKLNRNQILAIARAVTDKYLPDENLKVWMSNQGEICIERKKRKKELTFRIFYSPKDLIPGSAPFIFEEVIKGETLLFSKAFALESYEKVYGLDWYIILSRLLIKDINLFLEET